MDKTLDKIEIETGTIESLLKQIQPLNNTAKELQHALKKHKYNCIEYNNPIATMLKVEYESIVKRIILKHGNLPRNKLIKIIKEEVKRYPWNTWDEVSFTITEIKKEVRPRKGQIPLPII